VITASSAMEYAFEGDQLADTRELAPSVFTSALVKGLETGEADRDQDGLVALGELYDYVYDKVRAATPNQTPEKWTFGVQGELYIARRARPVTTPAPLPPELQEAIDSPFTRVRAGAVPELARLLGSRHAGLALAARQALERLAEDDSRTVSAEATAALGAKPPPPVPAGGDAATTPPQTAPEPQGGRAGQPDTAKPSPPVDNGAQDASAPVEAGFRKTLADISQRSVGDTLTLARGELRRMLPRTRRSRFVLAGLVVLLATAVGYLNYIDSRNSYGGGGGSSGHYGGVTGLAFSPDGKTLASASTDGRVLLWNPTTAQPIGQPSTGHSGGIISVAFSPDGKTLASGGEDTKVQLSNPATGFQPIPETLTGHSGGVTSVAFSPDGKTLASGGEDTKVRLWNPATGKPVGQPLTGHSGGVTSVAFSPDGKTLASASEDTKVRLWNPATGKPVGEPM
jgi:hypothetical protein